MFEFLQDPTIWAGLITLIVLEIVLGIDNLIFIAILSEKLPPEQRDQARKIGLSLALLMRLGLLAGMSWLVTLTEPFVTILGQGLSGRDVILLLGGAFLLFKATMEIHDRLEGALEEDEQDRQAYLAFWPVVAQIIVLDAVFSLDAVITAVGMVHHLPVMMTAVVIAMFLMIIASKPLTAFVNARPTIVMLCLGFLLMVGFSLVAEGLGFAIPKGYLYAAIGFSILIESFNQVGRFNRRRWLAQRTSLRQRTANAVLRMVGGSTPGGSAGGAADVVEDVAMAAFSQEETDIIKEVLSLAERPVRSIMTPRMEVKWLDVEEDAQQHLALVREVPYARLLVAREKIDEVIGVVRRSDLLDWHLKGSQEALETIVQKPLAIPEHMSILSVLRLFKERPVEMVTVVSEYGDLKGIITQTDMLKALVGEMADMTSATEEEEIQPMSEGKYRIKGQASVYEVQEHLGFSEIPQGSFSTMAGMVIQLIGHLPKKNESARWERWEFKVTRLKGNRVLEVQARRLKD